MSFELLNQKLYLILIKIKSRMKPTKLIISSMNVVCQVRNQTPNRITRKNVSKYGNFYYFCHVEKGIFE
jgi:hypothetical protein